MAGAALGASVRIGPPWAIVGGSEAVGAWGWRPPSADLAGRQWATFLGAACSFTPFPTKLFGSVRLGFGGSTVIFRKPLIVFSFLTFKGKLERISSVGSSVSKRRIYPSKKLVANLRLTTRGKWCDCFC